MKLDATIQLRTDVPASKDVKEVLAAVGSVLSGVSTPEVRATVYEVSPPSGNQPSEFVVEVNIETDLGPSADIRSVSGVFERLAATVRQASLQEF